MRSLALLLVVGFVAASSFPDNTGCVAEDEAGLTKVMKWVLPAVRTDAYTLRTGDGCDRTKDPTTYVPGQFTSIHLRTHKYKGQFRGLLLYATDANQNKVGDWQLDWPNSNMFWKPQNDACKNMSIMHLNGAEKYYHHEFKFIAPAVGTGKIEFHTLIKRGEANTGEFYYANLDKSLMLEEFAGSGSGTVWMQGAGGLETCTQTCAAVQKTCDNALYSNAFKWSGALQKDVSLSVGCASPALSADTAKTVSKDSEGWCTYPSPEVKLFEGACNTPAPTDTKNICPCGSAGLPSFGLVVPPPDTACLNEFIVMGAAPKSTSNIVSIIMVLLTGAFLNQQKHGNLLLTLVCVLFCAYTVQAHNWVYSVSRSFNQASTYKPCRPKVNDVPHWQINQGQEFWMEWATGHDHYFYFTVVHADDILLLEHTTQNDLDNYIKNCEARPGDNYMKDKRTAGKPVGHWSKQHINHDAKAKVTTLSNPPPSVEIYARNISEGDPLYFERHEKFGIDNRDVRWVYNTQFTEKDMRCSYFNSDLPYIVAVHRFVQVDTIMSRAGDRDTARFTIDIPTGYSDASGRRSGQFILQYLWRGYFDCADIDVFPPEIPIAVAAIGGRKLLPKEPQWNKIDHCQFEEIQSVETSCSEVVTNAERCLEQCVGNQNCGGVNVVPMWLPKTVYPLFSNRVGIPFDEMLSFGRCPRARFQGLSKDGKVCYGAQPRLPNNTHAMYSVTDDPEDPLFYGTCFIKRSQWAFDQSIGNGTKVVPVAPAWAYGSKCVDCNEWKASQENFNVPTWTLPEHCVNCEAAAAAGLLPPVPALPGKLISQGYKCDGGYDGRTIWRYQQKTPECATTKCVKVLTLAGSNNGIESDECLAKARADPQCSHIVQQRGKKGQTGACECFIKAEVEPCCGTCVPVDADFQTGRGKTSEWNIFSVAKPVADPTCERGVKSADGTYCCSASCLDANNVGVCMPMPGLQVSFQDAAIVAPDNWVVDNGAVFGDRSTQPNYRAGSLATKWGWNCQFNVASVNLRDRDPDDGTNFHGTTVRPVVSTACPNPEWSVEVGPGEFHVDTLYSDPNQNLRGCKIQGMNNFDATKVQLGGSDMAWVSRVVTVNATDTKITLTSNAMCGGYSAVVIYPKAQVPSTTSCQSLPGMCCPLFIDMANRPCSSYEAPCKLK